MLHAQNQAFLTSVVDTITRFISERELANVNARPSVCRLSSVTFVHPRRGSREKKLAGAKSGLARLTSPPGSGNYFL